MRQILLHVEPDEKIFAALDDGILNDLEIERNNNLDIVGRVYKGIVRNSVPSINGYFIDIGIGRNAFLRKRDLPADTNITEGSTVLVQVEKDSTETKSPLVTGKIGIQGKYFVMLVNSSYVGVSKKIVDTKRRSSLRSWVKSVRPDGKGIIIRTAAANVEEDVLKEEIEYLDHIFNIISKRSKVERGPVLLYRGSDLIVKGIRDYMNDDVESFFIDDEESFDRASELEKKKPNSLEDRLHYYHGPELLLEKFHVEEQIEQLFDRKVELKSGAYFVIDYTEALTVIDVNSGSFKGNGIPHSESAFLINKEAAVEIARQIKLREIGGIILVDFIDMNKKSQKDELLDTLKRAFQKDHNKAVVCGITSLGLVEITRKRTNQRLWQNYFDACPVCHGTGIVLSPESIARSIYHDLQKRKSGTGIKTGIKTGITIVCNKEVADFISIKDNITNFETLVNKPVKLEADDSLKWGVYSILSER